MRSYDVLWGRSPRLGTARRRQIQQATEAANRRTPSLAFLGLSLIALLIIVAIGILRLLLFGPWWTPPHTGATASHASLTRQAPGQARPAATSANKKHARSGTAGSQATSQQR